MSGIMIQPAQGKFTSTGAAQFIPLPQGFDYFEVTNNTVIADAVVDSGAYFTFDPNVDANGTGIQQIYTATGLVPAILAAGTGFFVVDTSDQTPSAIIPLTAISVGPPPQVTTGAGTTSILAENDTVRIYFTTNAGQLGGIDFTVGTITNTTFLLKYMVAINPAGTNGHWAKIPNNPIYYPRVRTIVNITQAAQAVVTFSVIHGFNVGQQIRLLIPAVTTVAYGMTQLNNQYFTIVAVDTVNNTVTLDVDTTTFTAFAFPLSVDGGFTPAIAVPAGMDTAEALRKNVNIHSDASRDTAQIGILLMPGVNSPAGIEDDVISWRSRQAFDIENE